MSIHKSLRSKGKLVRHRNVLSRMERINILKEDGRWSEEDSVFGLPKVANLKRKRRSKSKKEAKEEAEAAPTTEETETEEEKEKEEKKE